MVVVAGPGDEDLSASDDGTLNVVGIREGYDIFIEEPPRAKRRQRAGCLRLEVSQADSIRTIETCTKMQEENPARGRRCSNR